MSPKIAYQEEKKPKNATPSPPIFQSANHFFPAQIDDSTTTIYTAIIGDKVVDEADDSSTLIVGKIGNKVVNKVGDSTATILGKIAEEIVDEVGPLKSLTMKK